MAKYPGMVPYEQSRILIGHELSPEERSVRGTLITGLSDKDIRLLDMFEGPEYVREGVDVHPLNDLVNLSEYPIDNGALIPPKPPALPLASDLAPPIKADTYVFVLFKRLEPGLWSFEDFVKRNAWKWYGEQQPEDDVRWAELDEVATEK
ncbi:hypothetical protein DXG01_002227 [Tephrocybe rancida]|nr:hypothetical protein DXG01_002227 [Tephrocybe rancida]